MTQLTKREKVGQLFFPAAFINDSDKNIKAIEKLIQEHCIGGLTFFHSPQMAATNYEKKRDIPRNEKSYDRLVEIIKHYQSIAKYPLLMSIDAEWGLAMRVENTEQYPYALTLGASSDAELIYKVGKAIATDLKAAGIHLNLAPVMDINDNPANPVIGYRSFGEDKEKVSQFAMAFYQGMKTMGILGCAKHFPGHGNTAIDSHLSLPIIDRSEKELMSQELYPFIKAIEADIELIMPGHLAVPALTGSTSIPASLSEKAIVDLLRGKLGYKGAIMTDALNMHAVSNMFSEPGELELKAFNAGNDILSFSANVPKAIDVIYNRADSKRIEESFLHIESLKRKAGLLEESRPNISTSFSHTEAVSLREQLAETVITKIKDSGPIPERGLDKIACLVVNKSCDENQFCKSVSTFRKMPIYEMRNYSTQNQRALTKGLEQYDTIVVGLYVPNIKPHNSFGLKPELINWLSVMTKVKTVHLVVFGNPYSLDFIDYGSASCVFLAYQDMEELEKKAVEVLFGKTKASGVLPVKVKGYVVNI